MDKLAIEYIPINELTAYEDNARQHHSDDVEAIARSIRQFGMCDPIGVWGERNVIVEGHGRLLALKQLGRGEAPCIRLDHLTDEERRAYSLAHNKTAELSDWDWGLLEAELDRIADIDMSDFGFEMAFDDDEKVGDGAREYGEEEFADDKFENECPRCGFRYNS